MFDFRNLTEKQQINNISETKWHSKKKPQNAMARHSFKQIRSSDNKRKYRTETAKMPFLRTSITF